MPIREVERRTGLLPNTIRKCLRSAAVEPRPKVPERPGKLANWQQMEAGKSRNSRRTARQVHADIVVLGFEVAMAVSRLR